MKTKLKAEQKDVPLLSGYLHDSDFTPSDFQFHPDQNKFEIKINRIAYEKAERGKFLFFFSCNRYPSVNSRLLISKIEKMELEWLDNAFNKPDDKHQLLDIEVGKDNKIEIHSEYLKIILSHAGQVELSLEDISEPTKEKKVTDFSKSIFQGLEELEKLKY